jgi:Protein of unknown function (DUF3309)
LRDPRAVECADVAARAADEPCRLLPERGLGHTFALPAQRICEGTRCIRQRTEGRKRWRHSVHGVTELGENDLSLGTILPIVLILMLIGVVPAWRHSRGWGYAPSGMVGLVVVVLLVLLLMGRL